MKVAIIASGFLPVVDGVTVSGFHRLQKLSEWGHQVLLFCPDYRALAGIYPHWKDYTGEILPGVRVVNLSSTPFFVDFERNVSFWSYPTVVRELRSFEPDLVHVDEPERLFVGFWQVPGVKYAQQAGVPCVSFFRTNFLEYLEDFFPLPHRAIATLRFVIKKLILFVYNSYDLTLVSSRVTFQKIVDLGITNAHYANLLGFEVNFHPHLRTKSFFRQHYRLSLDRFVKLIFLGRLTWDKGWEFTIEAFSQLAAVIDLNQVALLIVGDGPIREEIAARLGEFAPNIHFFGRVPPEEVPALMANSDIHVTASEKETRGLTVLEAFAAGIPVLAPRAGGVVENIRDGWNGFLYAPQDCQDFAHKLTLLTNNQQLRQQLGRNGQQCIEQYTWEHTVGNLVRVWEAQIASSSPSSGSNADQ
ncbi:MAG: glycosyltransferase [Cyanophyceae cyanobacterium]